ncbi:50S ribosomal protein L25 [Glycine soja]|nr:50S ribosomal protein L25 [Glycine soja]
MRPMRSQLRLRTIHLKAGTDAPLNVTFIRAPSDALLKVDVPLVFRGEDVSPGLKKGASLNTIKRTVKYLCPADIIPPYIDVDLSELDVGQKLVMGDLKVHPALKLLQPRDEAVVKIMGQRVSELQKKK